MPVYTGRNLTITIDSVAYSGQVTNARVVPTQNTNQYVTLTSSYAKQEPVTWTLEVTGFQDWLTGATPGFSSAMYTAANTGTAVSFSLGIVAGASRTVTGNIIPIFSEIGGEATAALEQTYSFPIDGSVTLT